MKLKILMDNHTEIDVYYLGEPAVSYWIETEGKAFLFDAGYSDAFLKNAKDMGIDVTKAEAVVLSHSHNDHTGGLKPLLELDFEKKPDLIAHPDALLPHDWNGMDIGSPVSREELSEKFTLQMGKEPVWLTEKLVWLGEIPHTLDFEPAYAIGTVEKDGEKQEDYIIDDTALAFVGEKGLSINLVQWFQIKGRATHGECCCYCNLIYMSHGCYCLKSKVHSEVEALCDRICEAHAVCSL